MKDRIEKFLYTAASPDTRDNVELKAIYKEITGNEPKCKSDTCIIKMLTAVRKFYNKLLSTDKQNELPARKYILKDGNHAFAPGEGSVHNNDNTNDEGIAWYLKRYPHILKLLLN